MDTLSHLSAILNGIGWLTLLGLVWSAARAFSRVDSSLDTLVNNHAQHWQDSLQRLEVTQAEMTSEMRSLRQDIRDLARK